MATGGKQTPGSPKRDDIAALGKKIDTLVSMVGNMDTTLKTVMTEIKEIRSEVKEINVKVNEVSDLAHENERRIGGVSDENVKLKMQLVDLENRSRRKNIRIVGMEELQDPNGLVACLLNWWSELGVQITEEQIERAHRTFRRNRNNTRPRDVLVAFTREKIRDQTLKKLRAIPNLSFKGKRVFIFPDMAAETRKDRADLKPITKRLLEEGMKFTWGFPSTLIVFKDGKMFKAKNKEEGYRLLKDLGISQETRRRQGEDEDEEEDIDVGEFDRDDDNMDRTEEGELPQGQTTLASQLKAIEMEQKKKDKKQKRQEEQTSRNLRPRN